jgi:rhodanese-related sulfurtransferase
LRRRTIDGLLAEARAGLVRLTPQEALAAQADGAVLVDTRSERHRMAEGSLPGALVVERTTLEWRLDPSSETALPEASYDAHVVVVCSDGYSSSLAAATLQQLGITRATDVVGGFRAWKTAGLPVTDEPG